MSLRSLTGAQKVRDGSFIRVLRCDLPELDFSFRSHATGSPDGKEIL